MRNTRGNAQSWSMIIRSVKKEQNLKVSASILKSLLRPSGAPKVPAYTTSSHPHLLMVLEVHKSAYALRAYLSIKDIHHPVHFHAFDTAPLFSKWSLAQCTTCHTRLCSRKPVVTCKYCGLTLHRRCASVSSLPSSQHVTHCPKKVNY